jgi:hypothetical protein
MCFVNSDLCHLQHKLIGFYNRDEKCLQRGTDWAFKQSGLRSVYKRLIHLTSHSQACARAHTRTRTRTHTHTHTHTLKNCTLLSESRCALRLRYVDLVVSIEVTVEVCCCFTVFSCYKQ